MNNSFVFYRSFFDPVKDFDANTIAEYLKLLCSYALNDEELPTENMISKALFSMAKPQLDANKKRRENGKKGGAPIGNNNAGKQPKTTKNNQKQGKVDLDKIPDEKQSKNNLKQPKNNQKQPNVNVIGYYSKENNLYKENSTKEKSLLNFHKEVMSENYQGWRDLMSKNHRIKDFARALKDYEDWLIGSTMVGDVQTISDYQRIFFYNAKKFLSEDSKTEVDSKSAPVVINGIEYH